MTSLNPGMTALHPVVTSIHPGVMSLHPCVTSLHRGVTSLHPCVTSLHRGVTSPWCTSLHPGVTSLHPGVTSLHRGVTFTSPRCDHRYDVTSPRCDVTSPRHDVTSPRCDVTSRRRRRRRSRRRRAPPCRTARRVGRLARTADLAPVGGRGSSRPRCAAASQLRGAGRRPRTVGGARQPRCRTRRRTACRTAGAVFMSHT